VSLFFIHRQFQPRHDLPRKRLRKAPLLVIPRREHQFLQALALQFPQLLHEFFRRPHQTRRPNQLRINQLRLARM
jgi:hypothetical protein